VTSWIPAPGADSLPDLSGPSSRPTPAEGPPRPGFRPTRRQFLAAAALGLIDLACTSSPRGSPPPPGSILARTRGAAPVSVLGTGADAAAMTPGPNRFAFALIDAQGRALEGGEPEVWVAHSLRDRATGPYRAAWHPFTGYRRTGDRSPASALPGAYSTRIDVPGPGNWTVGIVLRGSPRTVAGVGILPVTERRTVGAIGTRAVSVHTPVGTTPAAIRAICTRTPVDRMHYISLDRALRNGKPTVACFSTPLLCQSRLCGPVTDEVILVFEAYGPSRANFIHVEEFLPGPDHQPPPATLQNRSPGFKAWKLETEPWVFVIDREGIIRFRSLGPVTAPEIEEALRPLL
jgi:hypothetical protein